MHLQYYHEVKDAITDNLKVSVNKAMAHQKAEHAKAVAEYEKGQVGRDALKAFKLKEKEQREERRKAEIQDQVAKKIEFPAGYWDKYPTGKWKDEDCLDEKEMAPILKKEKADSKDSECLLRRMSSKRSSSTDDSIILLYLFSPSYFALVLERRAALHAGRLSSSGRC